MRFFRKTVLGALLAVSMSLLSVASAEELLPIQQIRETTPTRWTETYETKWRTIQVDAEIIVPEVETFPIVKVQLMPQIPKSLLSEYANVQTNKNGTFTLDKLKNDYLRSNWAVRDSTVYLRGEIPDVLPALPENVTLTFAEAKELAFQEINRLWGLGEEDFLLDKLTVSGSVREYKKVNGEKQWGKAVSDEGSYKFLFTQLFHGIECEQALSCYGEWKLSSENLIREGTCGISFSNAENIKIRAHLYTETEVVYADVPLLPFSAAKAAIEQEIAAGYLRSIDVVKLCYIPYLDAKDKETLWLLPVWYVEGDYTRNPQQEYACQYDSETGALLDNGMEKHAVVFQAQAGTMLDYNDNRKDRRTVIPILQGVQNEP